MNKQTRKNARIGKGKPGPGRPQGSQNKFTATFKEAISIVYEKIGGHEGFATWAKKNRTDFYKIAARVIPHELVGSGDDGEHVLRIVHDAR